MQREACVEWGWGGGEKEKSHALLLEYTFLLQTLHVVYKQLQLELKRNY